MVTESNMHRDMIAQRPYAYLMYFLKLFSSKLKKKKTRKKQQKSSKTKGHPRKEGRGCVTAAASGKSNKTTLIPFLSLSSPFKLGFPSELY